MSVSKPKAMTVIIEEAEKKIHQHLADLPALYEWAHGASHERVVRESAGKITTGTNDPTASIVGEVVRTQDEHVGHQAAIRRQLEQVPKRLQEAENVLIGIEKSILGAMDRLDPREGFEQLRYPRTASEEDLEQARAAKRRREERGEGIA